MSGCSRSTPEKFAHDEVAFILFADPELWLKFPTQMTFGDAQVVPRGVSLPSFVA